MGNRQSRPTATSPLSAMEQTVEPAPMTTSEKNSTSGENLSEENSTSSPGKQAFASDLAEAVSSSRRALGYQSKPSNPLPTCFFELKPTGDCSFKFNFQWCSYDGVVIGVTVHDVEKYPKGHTWEVVNTEPKTNPAPSWVEDVLLKQKGWDGLRLREMLKAMNNGFWCH
ncbi:hypothetical protein K432DRAFT_224674 [Lepidopterella palustris CBS 459.81]|uniref:Uncharacterized protein n=1 Tax=Lepidopterella palustris CBS 459.81 TaxID=1314670 RepID=A0A8E2DY82_9PEZI|nr:hypothetical protein K432DRAFT_224674 [Lepidopterella palustris CBS 459.81]